MKSELEILLLEDNDDHIEIFKEYLEMSSFKNSNIKISDNLKDGLKLLKENYFDVVFLDLSLKDSSIYETIKVIKEFANIYPTIVLTSLDDKNTILNIIQSGADDCLPKSEVNSFLLERSIRFNIDRRNDKKLLRESELRFKQFADNVDIVFWIRTKNEMLYINKAYEKIWEKSCESLIQNPNSFFDNIHEDDLYIILKAFKEFELSGFFHKIYRLVMQNGAIKWIEVKAFPIFNENKEIIRSAGVAEDVTERKAYENLLSNFNSKLIEQVKVEVEEKMKLQKAQERDKQLLIQQSKMATMGEMIGAIAHQWRQPLNSLGLIVQKIKLAYQKGILDETYIDDSVEKSMKQINFMSQTIDDFRNFFKPNKELEYFEVIKSINEVLAMLLSQFKNHNINLEIIGDEVTINGYSNEFKQVILNILNNAKDAIITRQEKSEIVNGEIKIYIKTIKNNVFVEIEDNGGGIQIDIIDKIFEPYFSTKSSSNGTGIGLYISKSIIEDSLKGSIRVKNSLNGAIFTIIISN